MQGCGIYSGKPGDKVMIALGVHRGCTGTICEIKNESVIVAMDKPEPLSSKKRVDNRQGEAGLRKLISEVCENWSQDSDRLLAAWNMSKSTMMAKLIAKGLPSKMGKAGEEQRALIDELAFDLIRKHRLELVDKNTNKSERAAEGAQRNPWPLFYRKSYFSVVEVICLLPPCVLSHSSIVNKHKSLTKCRGIGSSPKNAFPSLLYVKVCPFRAAHHLLGSGETNRRVLSSRSGLAP